MDATIFGAAGDAFLILMDPTRLMFLFSGVLMGLFLGIVPGIGGLAGMALLLPFTFTMEPYAAFALLLGMWSVIGTSDTIPAVLFGVPGSSSAQATVLDGNAMAKNGEAGRALSAAFTSSLIGGVFGALLLAALIPLLRPIVLMISSPELLALSLFGISMVSVLAGGAPLRGLVAAMLGILLSMIGSDPQTGLPRWTMGETYLVDGLPIVPMVLGLFALPELADLAIRRSAIAGDAEIDTRAGRVEGFRDALRNWTLVLRCGGIGAAVGALPGLGSSVVDWIAYGHALQTVKGARDTFGKGDVRGVIAPESANNALNAGALVPTIAFGVPGSASMAILLSVFLIHGLVPGPAMLTKNLDVTYSMVWSIALANILGAGICFMCSGWLARITTLRYSLIVPAVLVFIYIGSFQANRSWGDLYTLLIFGVFGWAMKQLKWPRPPLVLGFVLGALIERYLFITFNRYGFDWLSRPIVAVLLALSVILILGPVWRHLRALGGLGGIASKIGPPVVRAPDAMHVFFLLLVAVMIAVIWPMPWKARIGPLIIGFTALSFAGLSFLYQIFSRGILLRDEAAGIGSAAGKVHMEADADHGDITQRQMLGRATMFCGYLLLFLALTALIGFLPAIPVVIAAFMRLEGRESWWHVAGQSVAMVTLIYVVFDQLLRLPWPPSVLGQVVPWLTAIPSV